MGVGRWSVGGEYLIGGVYREHGGQIEGIASSSLTLQIYLHSPLCLLADSSCQLGIHLGRENKRGILEQGPVLGLYGDEMPRQRYGPHVLLSLTAGTPRP